MIDTTRKTIALAHRTLKSYGANSLLSKVGVNPKLAKSDKAEKGYLSAIMHFAPANSSGYEVCPHRSAGCTAACLNTAGNPVFLSAKLKARKARTIFFFKHRDLFISLLAWELKKHITLANSVDMIPAVRLNGTSDIVWEKIAPELFTEFNNVQFYDYTKIGKRLTKAWNLPKNYYLLYSLSESSDSMKLAKRVLRAGGNVAVVFLGLGNSRWPKPLPSTWEGFPVHDADKDDLRFRDPIGSVAGLRAKGKARKDTTGFARLTIGQSSK